MTTPGMACPHCGAALRDVAEMAGQEVTCPKCDRPVTLSEPASAPPTKPFRPSREDWEHLTENLVECHRILASIDRRLWRFHWRLGAIVVLLLVVTVLIGMGVFSPP